MKYIINFIPESFTKIKKKFYYSLLIVLSLFCLTSCAKKKELVETGVPIVESAIEAGIEDESILSGGQITTFIPIGATSLNPLFNDSLEMQNMLLLTYEKLICYNEGLTLSPLLAESWVVDSDNRTWTIHLRKDVSWQNGKEFSTQDVIYTLDLLNSPEYAGSPYAYNLDEIESYTSIDKNTLVVVGKSEGEFALHALTVPIVSESEFKTSAAPVGTGPYVLKYADPSIGLQFDVNENWWKKTPHIPRIVAHAINDDTMALNSLVNNKLNFVATNSFTAKTYQEEGRRFALSIPTQRNEILLLNHNVSIIQEPEFRKAIAHALDRRDIVSKVFLGQAFISDVPIQPKSAFYDPEVNTYDYNLDKARELLENIGWKDLDGDGIRERSKSGEGTKRLSLRLIVNDTSENTARKSVAQMIKNQLELVGIEIRIISSGFSSESDEYLEALSSSKFDIALMGVYMDKCPNFTALVNSDGKLNFGNYKNYDIETLNNDIRKSVDDAQNTTINKFQRVFTNDLPFVELYFLNSAIVYSEQLQIENATMISEEEVFRGVESWHFTSEGLTLYPVYDLSTAAPTWNAYVNDPAFYNLTENEGEIADAEPKVDGETENTVPDIILPETNNNRSVNPITAPPSSVPNDMSDESGSEQMQEENEDLPIGDETIDGEEGMDEESGEDLDDFEDLEITDE